MPEEKYRVHLDNFDGPLDVLLHLIDKNKMDIYDIPIAVITSQYLEFLQAAREMDLDIASEFLLLAATLVSIKARMLLPKKQREEEAEDPRDELVSRLLEYRFYKETALLLKDSAERTGACALREIDVDTLAKSFTPANPVANIALTDLLAAFEKVLLHVQEAPPVIVMEKEIYDVELMMNEIIERLTVQRGLRFEELFSPGDSRKKIISIFLALLELLKLNVLTFQQEERFGVLWLFVRETDAECDEVGV